MTVKQINRFGVVPGYTQVDRAKTKPDPSEAIRTGIKLQSELHVAQLAVRGVQGLIDRVAVRDPIQEAGLLNGEDRTARHEAWAVLAPVNAVLLAREAQVTALEQSVELAAQACTL